MIIDQISHRNVSVVEEIIRIYEEKDGVSISYVCTTELRGDNSAWDVFYRDTPHPEFGNKYFGIRFGQSMFEGTTHGYINNADCVEEYEFGMVESNGVYHYSRYRHDYLTVGAGMMIDGGRAYIRAIGPVTIFHVRDGKLVRVVPAGSNLPPI